MDLKRELDELVVSLNAKYFEETPEVTTKLPSKIVSSEL
jgi:hypothetical protein